VFNVRSYDLIKDYSFGTERSTGIKDYHLKGCMEGQSLMLMTSGRKIACLPPVCLRNRQADPPWIHGEYPKE